MCKFISWTFPVNMNILKLWTRWTIGKSLTLYEINNFFHPISKIPLTFYLLKFSTWLRSKRSKSNMLYRILLYRIPRRYFMHLTQSNYSSWTNSVSWFISDDLIKSLSRLLNCDSSISFMVIICHAWFNFWNFFKFILWWLGNNNWWTRSFRIVFTESLVGCSTELFLISLFLAFFFIIFKNIKVFFLV